MGAPTMTDPRKTPTSVELLIAGSSFARYEIVRCIGVGGMGAVFEATHTLLRKRVALKALHGSLGRSEASRARFLREAETVARIRHAHVVDISDVGIERGIPFLVMEFLEGEDLASLLEREGRLDFQRAVDLLLPALAGLCAVHRLGIVHRDIKPENIFLAHDPLGGVLPKLVDFGVSKDVEASIMTGTPALRHTVAGTPFYMSPEQARGSSVLDGRADQYALAVVLYQCLTRARPFESDSLLELLHLIDAGSYLPLRERCPEVPESLAEVVRRAMALRIEDRFPTTEALGQALSPFASSEVSAACARDFAAERRSPLLARSQEVLERLSAPTLSSGSPTSVSSPSAVEADGALAAAPRRSLSGVRARDTEEPAAPSGGVPARSRRAFGLAFGVTFLLLAVLALVWSLSERGRSGPPVRVEPERARNEKSSSSPAPVAPRAETSSEKPAAAAPATIEPRDKPTPAGSRRSTRPRRDESTNSPAAPVDIQLSR